MTVAKSEAANKVLQDFVWDLNYSKMGGVIISSIANIKMLSA